jgi:xanthine/CO dehydrogenase XdhC/CoxF family maturation factor
MALERVWKKSTYSGTNGGDCVEAALVPAGAAVRDSRHVRLGRLETSRQEWAALVRAVAADSL